jgi:carbon storage regulator
VSGLVLTRRAGQGLRIGGNIDIDIARIEGDRVIVRIRAPREISIVRSEIVEAVADEAKIATEGRAQLTALFGAKVAAAEPASD